MVLHRSSKPPYLRVYGCNKGKTVQTAALTEAHGVQNTSSPIPSASGGEVGNINKIQQLYQSEIQYLKAGTFPHDFARSRTTQYYSKPEIFLLLKNGNTSVGMRMEKLLTLMSWIYTCGFLSRRPSLWFKNSSEFIPHEKCKKTYYEPYEHQAVFNNRFGTEFEYLDTLWYGFTTAFQLLVHIHELNRRKKGKAKGFRGIKY